ncbi:hypothetical protein LDENG_00191810, partial [Lucifuga dentata]
ANLRRKTTVFQELKTDDTENRSRRKNLSIFGLREGAEGTQPLMHFIQDMLPKWLGLSADQSPILQRVHLTLAPPKPNQNRAVLVRFLRFQDREDIYRRSREKSITFERVKLTFAQDFSAETMRQRREFNTVRKMFADMGKFRGFQLNPCKMRVFHNGKMLTFSSPQEAEEFHRGLQSRDSTQDGQ